mmetsp:Transcript_49983/g.133785  ORF Transcript_49983/g.133785 Transcript_49983/m.133785 type:complete len:280 (-) Transcript_49983:60-899(-)
MPLEGDLLVDADQVPQHQQEEEHRGGPAAEEEDAEARAREAALVLRRLQVRLGCRYEEALARAVRAARAALRDVPRDGKQRWDPAEKHHDQVAVVEPVVGERDQEHDQDIAAEAADQEHGGPNGARDLVLLRWQHLGADRLGGDVVQALAQPPDEDAQHEQREVPGPAGRALRGPMAQEDAKGGDYDPNAHEEPAAESVADEREPVADEAEDGRQEDAEAVDQLRNAHEERLVVLPEFRALHGQKVRQPRGTEEACVEAVEREAKNHRHGRRWRLHLVI